ncbi:transglycosylase [Bacillus subtilis]|uniref:transglycosylase n=1 Tax=Bacillus subtilis TaxID=1423 RepID=UPI0032656E73
MEDLETEHQTCMCDECGTMLLVKGCSKVRKHDDGIREHYIKCPRCRTEYTSYYTNADIRRMQQKVKKLFALRATMKKETAFDLYTKKLKEAQKKLEAPMLRLKEEMGTPHPKISEG